MSAAITAAGLTLNEERFAQALVASPNANQAEAYALAYNAHHWSRNALYVEASRLMDKPTILLRVRQLATDAAKAATLNNAWVLTRLMSNTDRAMQAEPVLDKDGKPIGEYTYQGQTANRSLEILAKHLGMLDDHSTIDVRDDAARLVLQRLGMAMQAKIEARGGRWESERAAEPSLLPTTIVAPLSPESDASASSGDGNDRP